MSYAVNEIFLSVQGEGAFTGRLAVFLRFSGCNLWTGIERDRAGATCKFCDTDFRSFVRFDAAWKLADAVATAWGSEERHRFVVVTGGEPALQYDHDLRTELKARGFFVQIETNGTVALKAPADWVCVSPKAGTLLALRRADELKVVVPQDGFSPEDAAELVEARYLSVQPMDGRDGSLAAALAFVRRNPSWRLGIQMHKMIGAR